MIKRSLIALGVLLALGLAGPAAAADLYDGSIKDQYMPVQAGGPMSWYIRGDVGYVAYDDPTVTQSGRFDLNGTAIEDTWSIGLGVGRYFSPNVRGDITYSYLFESDVTGTVGSASGSSYPGVHRFGLSSHVVLANLYYDFDRGSRFTPYLGVGLGATYNKTSSGTTVGGCACNGEIEDNGNWSVAGAFMAGFSINFGSRASYAGSIKDAPVEYDTRGRWNLDAGYRYLYLGEARTGNITGGGGTVTGDKAEDIFAHEFRVGLRYDIR
jgi:opacity protein-like surface antigen